MEKKTIPVFQKKKIRFSDTVATKNALRKLGLHSVCEESRCPNIGECFKNKTATFLILGDVCTRNCAFCCIKKGLPCPPDTEEPSRVLEAVRELGIEHVVITSVTRDDLPDGGAGFFGTTIKMIREAFPDKRIEVLVPDFMGKESSIRIVSDSLPDIFSHNVETVPSLYRAVRSKADYRRSLGVLELVKKLNRKQLTKSGLMLGLGEKMDEVVSTMRDIASAGCDFLSIGQYLAPGKKNHNISFHASEEDFEYLKLKGREMGFTHVESGRYVRSSYNAKRYIHPRKDSAQAL